MSQEDKNKKKDLTISLIVLSGICGGSVYPLIKIAEQYSIPKFAYIFWESLFVVLFLTGISLLKKQSELFRFSELKYYFFCALTNIIIPQCLFFILAPNIDANIMGLIVILTPLFVYLGLLGLQDIKFNIIQFMGVVIGLIGAIILFLPDVLDLTSDLKWFWILFSLSLPVNYAINRIVASRLKPKDSENAHIRLAIGLFGCVAVLTAGAMLISDDSYIPLLDLNYGDLALIAHAIVMVIFYMTFFILAKKGALQNSLGSYVIPVIALLWGVILFDEMVSIIYPISAILIFVGLLLTNKKPL